ncbi:MAG TPA: hypothetical protein VF251_04805 [Pyrinomonadaceae bacterium]
MPVIHKLANIFNGLHWFIGITVLPDNATPSEERSFVFMWLGIILTLLLFFALMIYLIL